MRTPLLIAILPLWLTACAGGSSDVCPTLMPYNAELQGQAAGELEALPPGSALARLMGDYAVVRAEIRACRGDR